MTTLYTIRATHCANIPTPASRIESRYIGAAELVQAIRAAAVCAPEFQPARIGRGFPAGAYEVGPRSRVEDGTFNGSGYEDWHGPLMPEPAQPFVGRVEFYFSAAGSRSSVAVANLRPDLLALADKVHRARSLYDGKAKQAPKPGLIACASPHVIAREMWADGDKAGAVMIAQARGGVFFGASRTDPVIYIAPELVEVAGHEWAIVRSVSDSRFVILHARSALQVNKTPFTTATAARSWLDSSAGCADWCAKVDERLTRATSYDQGAALAHYLPDVAPVEPVQATPVAPVAPPVVAVDSTTARIDELTARLFAAGLLARYGVSMPDACPVGSGAEVARIEVAAAIDARRQVNPAAVAGWPGCEPAPMVEPVEPLAPPAHAFAGPLATHSGAVSASWVIREKASGAVILETFDRRKVDALNTAKYEAVPIREHLAGLSRRDDAGPAPATYSDPAPSADPLPVDSGTPSRANDGGFSRRVTAAAAYIGGGRRTSRAFDSCFEMHDGDAVAVALMRRAEARPGTKLAANLWRYLSRSTVEAAAARQPAGMTLADWSRAQVAERGAKPAPVASAPLPVEPAPVADPVPANTQPAAVARPGWVSLMLHNAMAPLQNAAADGVPSVAGLESEAARIAASGETMRDVLPQYAAECIEVARSLRDLAEIERARLAEFEQAQREQAAAPAYVEITAAHYRPAGPVLRIPAFDARVMIPHRFAPVYLLQA